MENEIEVWPKWLCKQLKSIDICVTCCNRSCIINPQGPSAKRSKENQDSVSSGGFQDLPDKRVLILKYYFGDFVLYCIKMTKTNWTMKFICIQFWICPWLFFSTSVVCEFSQICFLKTTKRNDRTIVTIFRSKIYYKKINMIFISCQL